MLNRHIDKFTISGLRKFLERNHHEAEIFPTTTTKKKKYQNRSVLRKNIGEQTLKIYIHRQTV